MNRPASLSPTDLRPPRSRTLPAATAAGSSQVDGNFTYQNNTGWLYVGSPLRVVHNFTASGNSAYPTHWDTSGGLNVLGKTSVS